MKESNENKSESYTKLCKVTNELMSTINTPIFNLIFILLVIKFFIF